MTSIDKNEFLPTVSRNREFEITDEFGDTFFIHERDVDKDEGYMCVGFREGNDMTDKRVVVSTRALDALITTLLEVRKLL